MFSLDMSSSDYPLLLRDLSDPPKKLYIKGDYSPELFKKCIAAVGSRKITDYGKKVTQFLIPKIVSQGITVVSGFMYGVDAESHKVTLACGGKTIAVMPCGIDIICPEFQRELYEKILSTGGLIISEYPEKTEPKIWTFPRRNRLVAALCQSTLVIEAGDKSGSLITANVAHKLGRKVFSVPGNIFLPSIKGNWQLIKEYATPVISGCEIGEFYRQYFSDVCLPIVAESAKFSGSLCKGKESLLYTDLLSSDEKFLMGILAQDSLSIDQIYVKANIPIQKTISLITSLSIKDLISQEGNRYYAR